jgi:hypothetical protein
MANALSWIIREAKHLRRKDRNRKEWKDYVAQASAIYARKHKGKSPVGKKRHAVHRRPRKARPVKRAGSVVTASRSHTDRNKITANIQVGRVTAGTLAAELKRRIKTGIDRHVLAKYHAGTKRDKRRHQKEITSLKAKLRRLS